MLHPTILDDVGFTNANILIRDLTLDINNSSGDDEDSEDRHYPKITPPVPSAPRTKSQSSGKYSSIIELERNGNGTIRKS